MLPCHPFLVPVSPAVLEEIDSPTVIPRLRLLGLFPAQQESLSWWVPALVRTSVPAWGMVAVFQQFLVLPEALA